MNPDSTHSLNSLRVLSVDMISYSKSGYPGISLGAAPILFTLYTKFMKIKPSDPLWPNRDRFVLSAAHGSALLYAMLFMAGYDITIDDLVEYRKTGSKTPAMPEYKKTPGIDATTGPLGQGLATAVGMAMAEKYLASLVEEEVPKQKIVDYYTYCLVSDGDLMEGIADEAASLAGTLCLSKLIVLYDSNDITVDGSKSNADTENILSKYQAMGWEVDYVAEGNDSRKIEESIARAKQNRKPTIIEIKTTIGRGAPQQGRNIIHGKPLSREDLIHVRKVYNISTNTMEVTEKAVKYVKKAISDRCDSSYKNWQNLFKSTKKGASENLTKVLNLIETGNCEIPFSSGLFRLQNDYNEELRESNSKMLNIISDRSRFFLGGSADLASSCHTNLFKEVEMSRRNKNGKNIYFGLRENAMGAIMNGMALSGLRVFGSTYLIFADYLKPSLRMSAIMDLPVIYIFTHDSPILGEDGPTSQPIEQLAMLRTIPNLIVFRPADINEVIGVWDYTLKSKKPTAIVLSKDEAHILAGTSSDKVAQGAYIVRGETNRLDGVIVSTGTDFTTSYLISEELRAKGYDLRVVSMPSVNLFLQQPIEYQNAVLPPNAKIFTVEASSTMPWYRFASKNCAIGIDTFGTNGSKEDITKKLQYDYETILAKIEQQLQL